MATTRTTEISSKLMEYVLSKACPMRSMVPSIWVGGVSGQGATMDCTTSAAVMAQLTDQTSDFAQLTKDLQSIQLDSLKAMNNFTDGMQDALKQAVRLSQ